jgi:excisionase family DNA binding protein
MTDLTAAPLAALRAAVDGLQAAALPALVGALEEIKAVAWARMVTATPTAQQAPTVSATADELAAIHKVPRSFFYELARAGRIPCERLGRYVRFNRAAVEQALANDAKSVRLGTRKKRRQNGAVQGAATAPLPRDQAESGAADA